MLKNLATLIPVIAICLITLSAQAKKQPPNIILIMADDLGFETIGANGGTSYKTPNIDKLAKSGMKFNHCYAQPLCTPSRVKIMTGISNIRNYVKFGYLDPKQKTFAHLLKSAGYKTCVVGKWQLLGGPNAPQKFGFDQHCLWQLARRKKSLTSRYPNPGLEINGKNADFPLGSYGPLEVNKFARNFIKKNNSKPFLLYYPMILTHCPFEPTPDSKDWDPKSKGSKTYKGKARYFKDMVSYMDKMVGNIVTELKTQGIYDNTIIIFTGDNGTDKPIISMMGSRKIIGGKGKMDNTGNHVPLIINWPKTIKPNQTSNHIIQFTDFLPTLCAAANIKPPTSPTLDGTSFLPQLKGKPADPTKSIHIWYSRHGNQKQAKSFTRTQQYKLYATGKFYDIKNDPNEKSPLKTLNSIQHQTKQNLKTHLNKFKNKRLECIK